MEFESQRTKRKLDKETIAKYERVCRELLADYDEAAKVLAAFGKRVNGATQVRLKPNVAAPVIYELREFLEREGKPTFQSKIIKAIGDARHEKYPTLLRPWGDVWKSLEYQARNNAEIVPVEWHGGRLVQAPLKPKLPAPRIIGGTEDCPELYEVPPNLFWFKDKITSKRRKK